MTRRLVAPVIWMLAIAGAVAQQPSAAGGEAEPVTFNRDAAPILNRHCPSCHRPGQMAAMSLLTYDSARPWAQSILPPSSTA